MVLNIMNNFIDTYFNSEDVFYIFLLNRTNELNTTQKTKSYYCDKELFIKHYENYLKWNKKGIDIYFSLNTFKKIDNKVYRQEKYINEIKTLFFDIDTNAETIKPQIINDLGVPTYEIQTSKNKYQLLYCLENNSNIDNETFKNVSKTLTYHFNTDTTFDTARVARLPNLINNKNQFKVQFSKSSNLYTLKHFENYIADNKLSAPQKEKKKISKPSKMVDKFSFKKSAPNISYLEKYNSFLEKNGNDYSAADFSFCVYLTKVRKLKNSKTIFKHFLNTCPNIEKRHSNIQEYFNQILSKI
jgi:hypothetical protein